MPSWSLPVLLKLLYYSKKVKENRRMAEDSLPQEGWQRFRPAIDKARRHQGDLSFRIEPFTRWKQF